MKNDDPDKGQTINREEGVVSLGGTTNCTEAGSVSAGKGMEEGQGRRRSVGNGDKSTD